MEFFEFDSEGFEAAAPATARSSTSTTRPTSSVTSSATSRSAARPSSRPASGATKPSAARPSPSPSARTTPLSSSTTSRAGGFSFSQFAPYLQQGLKFAQLGSQLAQQFGGARGAPPSGQPPPSPPSPADVPTADVPAATGSPGPDVLQPAAAAHPAPGGAPDAGATAVPSALDQFSLLLQALQQRQIPPLPGTGPQVPVSAPPLTGVDPQTAGLALLRSILTNPQFQQTLHLAGAAGPRAVSLPVPAVSQPRQRRAVEIPLGAVMNAIALLARQSMTELNASTREDEPALPSYLVDEQGEYFVDPADATARASLVTHWFELSEQAEVVEQAEQKHVGEAYEGLRSGCRNG